MDASDLNRGRLIGAASGFLLFVVMFLSWFETSTVGGRDFSAAAFLAGVDTTLNAWQAFEFIDFVLALTAVTAIAAAVLGVVNGQRAPVSLDPVVLGLGLLSTLLVLYTVIDPVLDAGRRFGLFLGLLAAAGVVAGAWLSMQESGNASRRTGVPEAPAP